MFITIAGFCRSDHYRSTNSLRARWNPSYCRGSYASLSVELTRFEPQTPCLPGMPADIAAQVCQGFWQAKRDTPQGFQANWSKSWAVHWHGVATRDTRLDQERDQERAADFDAPSVVRFTSNESLLYVAALTHRPPILPAMRLPSWTNFCCVAASGRSLPAPRILLEGSPGGRRRRFAGR
jgi:hypothetical protein